MGKTWTSWLVLATLVVLPAVVYTWGSKPPPPPKVEKNVIQEIGQYFVNFFNWAENWTFPHIPGNVSVLDTVLSIDVCASYRKAMGKNKHPWLQVFVSGVIGCFGGTTMSALILGQPPGWLGSTTSPLAYILGFWLIFCCPGDLPFKAVTRIFPLYYLLNVLNCISGAHAVSSWGMEKALHAFHLGETTMEKADSGMRIAYAGSAPYALLCGTLSGCGGGVLCLWLACDGSSTNWNISTPPTLRKPSTTVKLAFLSAIIYYALRNPHHVLPWEHNVIPADVARTLLWLLWVTVMTLGDVFKVADPLSWMMPAFGTVLLLQGEIGGEAESGVYEQLMGGPAVSSQKKKD